MPSSLTISTSGYFCVSHGGGAAEACQESSRCHAREEFRSRAAATQNQICPPSAPSTTRRIRRRATLVKPMSAIMRASSSHSAPAFDRGSSRRRAAAALWASRFARHCQRLPQQAEAPKFSMATPRHLEPHQHWPEIFVGNARRRASVNPPARMITRGVDGHLPPHNLRCQENAFFMRNLSTLGRFEAQFQLKATSTHRIRRSASFIGASLMLATLRRINPSGLNSHSSTPYDRNH